MRASGKRDALEVRVRELEWAIRLAFVNMDVDSRNRRISPGGPTLREVLVPYIPVVERESHEGQGPSQDEGGSSSSPQET